MRVRHRYVPLVAGWLLILALALFGLSLAGGRSGSGSQGGGVYDSSDPAAAAPSGPCAVPPCVDGSALDGRVNIFVTPGEFTRLARRWCGLRDGDTRGGVRFIIHQTKGLIYEPSTAAAPRDVWNVAISQGAMMGANLPIDARLEARYTASGYVSSLAWSHRPGAPSLPCRAQR